MIQLGKFFNKQLDINKGVSEFKENKNAVLLDVRTKEEFSEGHIRGSINIPLQNIENAENLIQDKDKTLYVYCYSGARSAEAAERLKQLKYNSVIDLGGIVNYQGEVIGG